MDGICTFVCKFLCACDRYSTDFLHYIQNCYSAWQGPYLLAWCVIAITGHRYKSFNALFSSVACKRRKMQLIPLMKIFRWNFRKFAMPIDDGYNSIQVCIFWLSNKIGNSIEYKLKCVKIDCGWASPWGVYV